MKRWYKLFILLVFSTLLQVTGCRSKPQPRLENNPFKEVERALPSIHQDSPEVMAQKIFEADKNEVEKIGPQVLRGWREKAGVLVLDLMDDPTRAQFGVLHESQKWDGKKVFKVAQNTPIVLVASHRQMSFVERAYRKLQKQGYQNLFVLDGGIEAWAGIYGQR